MTFQVGDVVELKRASPGLCTGEVIERDGQLYVEFLPKRASWRSLDNCMRFDTVISVKKVNA